MTERTKTPRSSHSGESLRLGEVFKSRDRFLSRFLWQLVLEEPRGRKPRRPRGGSHGR